MGQDPDGEFGPGMGPAARRAKADRPTTREMAAHAVSHDAAYGGDCSGCGSDAARAIGNAVSSPSFWVGVGHVLSQIFNPANGFFELFGGGGHSGPVYYIHQQGSALYDLIGVRDGLAATQAPIKYPMGAIILTAEMQSGSP